MCCVAVHYSLQLRVWNDSKREADLLLAGLNPSGCFSFVNAPRTIAPTGNTLAISFGVCVFFHSDDNVRAEYMDIIVQFRPLSSKKYVETPTVSASHRGAALECKQQASMCVCQHARIVQVCLTCTCVAACVVHACSCY